MHRESIYGAFVARQRIGVKVFTLEPDAMVITSTYVTQDRLSILEVTHQYDEDEGHCWQFHCGNGDYSMEKMQMVRLSTILKIDPTVELASDLPVDHVATRSGSKEGWVYAPE
jgi:hypothetical protein